MLFCLGNQTHLPSTYHHCLILHKGLNLWKKIRYGPKLHTLHTTYLMIKKKSEIFQLAAAHPLKIKNYVVYKDEQKVKTQCHMSYRLQIIALYRMADVPGNLLAHQFTTRQMQHDKKF